MRSLRFLVTCSSSIHPKGKMYPDVYSYKSFNISPPYSVHCSNSTLTNIRQLEVPTTRNHSATSSTYTTKTIVAPTTKNNDKSIWLKLCLSMKDVTNSDYTEWMDTIVVDDPIRSYHKYKRVNCTLMSIKKKAYELFDTIEHLEYYDTKQQIWCNINDLSIKNKNNTNNNNDDVTLQSIGRVLHLRIPEYFDSSLVVNDTDSNTDDDTNDPNHSDNRIHPSGNNHNLVENDTNDLDCLEKFIAYRQDENDDLLAYLASFKNLYEVYEQYNGVFTGGDVVIPVLPASGLTDKEKLAIVRNLTTTATITADRCSTKNDTTTLQNNDRNTPEYRIEQLIRTLQKKLKEKGYTRSTIKMMTMYHIQNRDEISTREWVLQECETSTPLLRAIIIGRTNAVHHIVQCLHYDFLWRDIK